MSSEIVEVNGVLVDLSWPKLSNGIRKGLVRGWYERREAAGAQQLLQDGDTVLEIGGGCGFLSSFISKIGRAKRIISVEADPDLIPWMRQTHALNGASVEVFNEVLSDERGRTDFFVADEFWISSCRPLKGASYRKISVPTTSFRDRLAEWQPNLLVVDIEGGERELLRQPLGTSVRSVVVEVHQRAYGLRGVKEIMDRLSELGFGYVPSASLGAILSYRRL